MTARDQPGISHGGHCVTERVEVSSRDAPRAVTWRTRDQVRPKQSNKSHEICKKKTISALFPEFHPLTAKLFNLNFHPLEVVGE